jgi:hypothetical protein
MGDEGEKRLRYKPMGQATPNCRRVNMQLYRSAHNRVIPPLEWGDALAHPREFDASTAQESSELGLTVWPCFG